MSKRISLIKNLLCITLTKNGPIILFQTNEPERKAMSAAKYPGRNFQVLTEDLRKFQGKTHLDCDGYVLDISDDSQRVRVTFTVGQENFERVVTAEKLVMAIEMVDGLEEEYARGLQNAAVKPAAEIRVVQAGSFVSPAPVAASKPAPAPVVVVEAPKPKKDKNERPEGAKKLTELTQEIGVTAHVITLYLASGACGGYAIPNAGHGFIPADKVALVMAKFGKKGTESATK